MPANPTYHAKKANSSAREEPYGAPVTTPRHAAFGAAKARRPGMPPKHFVRSPKRIVDPDTIFLLDELPRPVRGCECSAFRCSELLTDGRAKCKRNNMVLEVKKGRAQRCPDCRRGAKS